MDDKNGKEMNATFGSIMREFIRKELEATAVYLGYTATQQQKSYWMKLNVEELLQESQLAREAIQLKQTLELGEHIGQEIEKERIKKDVPEGMLS